MRFQPGNAGGPGRPRGSYLLPQAKQWAEIGGVRLLLRLADGKEKGWSKATRWDAIKLALAYGLGKPREALEITAEDQRPGPDLSALDIPTLEKLAGMATCPADCCAFTKSGKLPPVLEIPTAALLGRPACR